MTELPSANIVYDFSVNLSALAFLEENIYQQVLQLI